MVTEIFTVVKYRRVPIFCLGSLCVCYGCACACVPLRVLITVHLK